MKRANLVCLVAASAMFASAAYAQPPGPGGRAGGQIARGPISGGLPAGVITQIGAGNYSFFQYDASQMQSRYLDILEKRNDADRQYFINYVKDITTQIESLIKGPVYGRKGVVGYDGLAALSQRSSAARDLRSGGVTADEYLSAINRFNEAKAAIDLKIDSLASISEAFPSQSNLTIQGVGSANMPKYGDVNFNAIKDSFKQKIAALETTISNFGYLVVFPDRRDPNSNAPYFVRIAPNTGKGLVLESPYAALDAKQLEALRLRVLKDKTWDGDALIALERFAKFAKAQAQQFIVTWGSTEKYRRLAPHQKKLMAQQAEQLADIFWARSYFRTMFSMPLCAIGVQYDKQVAGIDYLTMTASKLKFMQDPICPNPTNQNSMMQIEQNYLNLANTLGAQSGGLIQRVMKGELSVVGALANLRTYLKGERNWNEAAMAMIQLLAADFAEESLIAQPGNAAKMKALYTGRYNITPESKAHYLALRKALDPENVPAEAGAENDPWGGAGGVGGGMAMEFKNVLVYMNTLDDKLADAEALEAQIANSTNPNNKYRTARKARGADI